MAVSVEKTAKTVDEARQAALLELGVSEDEVSFEILEEPKKALFGMFGGRDARVRVTVLEKTPLDRADAFLRSIFTKMALSVSVEKEEKDGVVVLRLSGENLGILIGKHGQTLDALQYLTNLAANRGIEENRLHIVLDVEHYRERREETLVHLAQRLADKVRHTGRKVMLEPMNRHERKVIHIALQENRYVTTSSAGEEPYRKVVIEPRRRSNRSGAPRTGEEE